MLNILVRPAIAIAACLWILVLIGISLRPIEPDPLKVPGAWFARSGGVPADRMWYVTDR